MSYTATDPADVARYIIASNWNLADLNPAPTIAKLSNLYTVQPRGDDDNFVRTYYISEIYANQDGTLDHQDENYQIGIKLDAYTEGYLQLLKQGVKNAINVSRKTPVGGFDLILMSRGYRDPNAPPNIWTFDLEVFLEKIQTTL